MSEKALAAQKERLEKAAIKLKQEKAKMQRLAARSKYQETKKVRALDTRKKVLAGAYVLDRAEKDAGAKARLMAGLEEFLTRDADRELFGFSPLGSPSEAPQKPAEAQTTQPATKEWFRS